MSAYRVQLHRWLDGFDVRTVEFMAWKGKHDREVLKAAEGQFDVLLPSDPFMLREGEAASRGLAVVLLSTNRLRDVEQLVPDIARAITAVAPGEQLQVPIQTPAADQ